METHYERRSFPIILIIVIFLGGLGYLTHNFVFRTVSELVSTPTIVRELKNGKIIGNVVIRYSDLQSILPASQDTILGISTDEITRLTNYLVKSAEIQNLGLELGLGTSDQTGPQNLNFDLVNKTRAYLSQHSKTYLSGELLLIPASITPDEVTQIRDKLDSGSIMSDFALQTLTDPATTVTDSISVISHFQFTELNPATAIFNDTFTTTLWNLPPGLSQIITLKDDYSPAIQGYAIVNIDTQSISADPVTVSNLLYE